MIRLLFLDINKALVLTLIEFLICNQSLIAFLAAGVRKISRFLLPLIEDTYQPEQDKRWVVVSPPGSNGTTILLARASKPEQEPFIGNQAGGRAFLFLGTDDFWRDYNEMKNMGIEFIREPKEQDYGAIAVFKYLYGNLWDLVEFNENHPMFKRIK